MFYNRSVSVQHSLCAQRKHTLSYSYSVLVILHALLALRQGVFHSTHKLVYMLTTRCSQARTTEMKAISSVQQAQCSWLSLDIFNLVFTYVPVHTLASAPRPCTLLPQA
jgi:hypothetical protein